MGLQWNHSFQGHGYTHISGISRLQLRLLSLLHLYRMEMKSSMGGIISWNESMVMWGQDNKHLKLPYLQRYPYVFFSREVRKKTLKCPMFIYLHKYPSDKSISLWYLGSKDMIWSLVTLSFEDWSRVFWGNKQKTRRYGGDNLGHYARLPKLLQNLLASYNWGLMSSQFSYSYSYCSFWPWGFLKLSTV